MVAGHEELWGEGGGDGGIVGGVAEVDFEVPGGGAGCGEGFADAAGEADGTEIFEGVAELRGGVAGSERGVAGDRGGAGNEDIGAAGGAGDDGRAGKAGRARPVLARIGVGGDLAGIFEMPDGVRTRGEDDGEAIGFEADAGGGGETLGEAGAERGLEGEGAAAAEGLVVFEAGGVGGVYLGNVVPDASERAVVGGLKEIAVEAMGGGFGGFAGAAGGAAEEPVARAVEREVTGSAGGLGGGENGFGGIAAEERQAERPGGGSGGDQRKVEQHGSGNYRGAEPESGGTRGGADGRRSMATEKEANHAGAVPGVQGDFYGVKSVGSWGLVWAGGGA